MALFMTMNYAVNMKLMRHFSDTRTEVGRVRFLLADGGNAAEKSASPAVELVAEGPGWCHRSEHGSLHEAAQLLAFLPEVPQRLYEASLCELQRRLELERVA